MFSYTVKNDITTWNQGGLHYLRQNHEVFQSRKRWYWLRTRKCEKTKGVQELMERVCMNISKILKTTCTNFGTDCHQGVTSLKVYVRLKSPKAKVNGEHWEFQQ